MVKDNKTRYTLRIDDNLLEKVHVICKKEQRSLNQQLIFMLQNLVDDYEKQYGLRSLIEMAFSSQLGIP